MSHPTWRDDGDNGWTPRRRHSRKAILAAAIVLAIVIAFVIGIAETVQR